MADSILGSLLAPLLVRSARPASVMAAGLALASIGFAILTQVGITSGLAAFVTGSVVLSLGMAPVFTLVTNTVLIPLRQSEQVQPQGCRNEH